MLPHNVFWRFYSLFIFISVYGESTKLTSILTSQKYHLIKLWKILIYLYSRPSLKFKRLYKEMFI
nr:MAG TPA: hypothetical protein [Caudoviricetes sp.]